MSIPSHPGVFKLVMGVLYSDEDAFKKGQDACLRLFGPLDDRLGPMPFQWSDYYEKEMGPDIHRLFWSFQRPVQPDALPDIKLATNEIEDELARGGARVVNLDPGVVTPWNLVLATGKPRHQRVYQGNGIFGDLTLIFHTGAFHSLPWTYPDWGSEAVREFLGKARESMKQARKGESHGGQDANRTQPDG